MVMYGAAGRFGAATGNLVLDRVLAGPLPEAFARSLVEHRVLSRVAAGLVASGGKDTRELEELEELVQRALSSPAFERLAADLSGRIVQSAEFHRVLKS